MNEVKEPLNTVKDLNQAVLPDLKDKYQDLASAAATFSTSLLVMLKTLLSVIS